MTEYPAHDLLANCTKIADLVSADESFHTKLVAEYRVLQQQAAANYNSTVAALKLAELFEEFLQFGDNLTKGQRDMINQALANYKPQQ